MNCPSCSKEIPDGSVFCNLCGKSTQSQAKQSSAKLFFVWGLGIFTGVMVAIGAYLYMDTQRIKDSIKKTTPSNTTQAAPVPVFIPMTQTLVAGQLIVKPGSDVRYKLQIDTIKMLNPVVAGSFRASGGAGNDIQVVLADEDSFENWINGHPSQVLYGTDKTTNGKLYVPITQTGTYYLSFNNRFSTFAEKQVFADVILTYQVQSPASNP